MNFKMMLGFNVLENDVGFLTILKMMLDVDENEDDAGFWFGR